jgi:hypothetical protein
MKFIIPRCLKDEHEELHLELARAMREADPLGAAAKSVKELMRVHAFNEEHYALPPLGLLLPLARGEATPEMLNVVALTEDLQKNLPVMLADHKTIVAALKKLAVAATTVGKPEYAAIAEKLIQHIQVEEQIAYPAAILVGEYLKLRFNVSGSRTHDSEVPAIPDIG